MSTINADIALAELRDIFIHEIFHNEFDIIPDVRFGVVQRKDKHQFCPNVRRTDYDTGHEIIIAEDIAHNRELVAQTLIHSLIRALAMQQNKKIACRAGSTKNTDDYTGRYHNNLFKEFAEKYGLIVDYFGASDGWQPVGITNEVKDILKKYHIEFTAVREKYLYGRKKYAGHNQKCICPRCGNVNYYETKNQRLYCANCMDEIAKEWFGQSWNTFINMYRDNVSTVRANKKIKVKGDNI